MLYLLSELLSFILIMVFVAFFILAERKVLGYIQLRKGPNKTGLIGLFQSFADLGKLILKTKTYSFQYRSLFSLFGVYLLVVVSLLYCNIYALYSLDYNNPYLLLFFFLLTSLSSYSILSVGWGSNNKYSLYGSLRSSFGAVSYEMSFMCFLLILGCILGFYSVYDPYFNSSVYSNIILLWPIYILFLLCSLCETNRIPFDFAESKSDLVSGFNTEFCNTHFVCLFACEYLIVFIMGWFSSVYFFSGFIYYIMIMLTIFFFLWSRGTLPRLYYNVFIEFFWVYLLVFLSWFILIIL
uniref:NADH-ubiquinone oxidoreductase chain 1 n=1 Tax=Gyrodactylus kobayashii TaxID=89149 RepID=A0A166A4A1_9PLAT|nr:NADH dehydrogenase subunit 1 [Gyrodactylus kobayashii]AMZ79732.1 NADH dehydrogenase subunit 1 [Gyrodactylus kobayashii]